MPRGAPFDLRSISAERIGVIKPSALGDVVQTLPLLPVLRERFPSASISWVISRPLAAILEDHPCLDDVIPFDRRGGWRHWLTLRRELRNRRFDLVFDLQGLLRTGLMTWATRAKYRVGLETAREGSHLACHLTLPDTSRHVPAAVRYWRVAEEIGMGERRRETIVNISAEDRATVNRILRPVGRNFLAVHAGAQWVTKRWPPGRFAYVAAKATRYFGLPTVIVGGPGEECIAAEVEHHLRRFLPAHGVLNLAGRTTLKQLAVVLQFAQTLVCNDSGPMHLAAGLGTPVVGVFTCTNPLRSGPIGNRHQLVSTQLDCAGSYCKRCPFAGARHMACHEELHADRVWHGLVQVLQDGNVRKAA